MAIDAILEKTLLAMAAFATFGFLLSRLLRRNDVADVLWGPGVFFTGLIHALPQAELPFRAKLLLALTGAWALRLSLHIFFRNRGRPEDIRYQNWKKAWAAKGQSEPGSAFLRVFCLQSLLMAVIASPLILVVTQPATPLGALDFAGTILFVIGFVFESTSDEQLRRFKKSGRGKILNEGLWALCRHPNYFGEILIWWGFFAMAAGSPWGLCSVVSPVLLTFLLLRVSGVPMLEDVLKSKGAEHTRYLKDTRSLLPFSASQFAAFLLSACVIMLMDFFWLGLIMNDFYLRELSTLGRIVDGRWDAILWAAAFVYVLLPLGVSLWASTPSTRPPIAVFRGTILGLIIYGVYDLTNLALIRDWPIAMSLIDMIWGAALCGTSAGIHALFMNSRAKSSL